MKYSMSMEDSFFVKSEGVNSIVISKVNGHSIYLNRVATWLFNHLSAYTNSEELFEKMIQQFTGVNRDILKKDLMSFLHVMEVYQIIAIQGEDNEEEPVPYKISFADDCTYKRICDFICDSETKCWLAKPLPELPFTPLKLHQKSFSNEEVFLQYIKDNEIKLVVSYKMPMQGSKVLELHRIYSRNIDDDDLVIGIKLIHQRILTMITDEPKKTRAIVYQYKEDTEHYNNVVKLLQKCGFNKECELNDEFEDINAYYYILYNSKV